MTAPSARSRAQHSQPIRTGVQNLACVNRQQRHSASQQHRKKIQRHAAQNQLIAPDVAEAVQDHNHPLLSVAPRRDVDANCRQQKHRHEIRDRGACINRHRAPCKAVNQASRHGSENGRSLKERRAPRHGVRKMLGLHQLRKKGLAGRPIKGTHRAVGEQHRVDGPDRHQSTERERQQNNGTKREPCVANSEYGLPRTPVRGVSSHQE